MKVVLPLLAACAFGQLGPVPTNLSAVKKSSGVFQVTAIGLVVAIEVSIAPNSGKLLLVSRNSNVKEKPLIHAQEYDYTTNTQRPVTFQTDSFCGAGLITPSKKFRVINLGGWSGTPGLEAIRFFTPCGGPGVFGDCNFAEDTAIAKMKKPRWYPTVLPLPNGRAAIIGGNDGNYYGQGTSLQPNVEFLPPRRGEEAIELPFLVKTRALYPIAHVMSTGEVFMLGDRSAVLANPDTFETVKALPDISGKRTYTSTAASALLSLKSSNGWKNEVLVCGGSNSLIYDAKAQTSCGRIDPNVDTKWTMEEMRYARTMGEMIILADGKVLLINGSQDGAAGFNPTRPVLYDPDAPVGKRFQTLAESKVARMYHSVAIMVEDGSVFLAGSTPNALQLPGPEALWSISKPETKGGPNEHRIERFYPPYLLTGHPRPEVKAKFNGTMLHGREFTFSVTLFSDDPSNAEVSLFTNGFVTHSVHMGQRRVVLDAQWIKLSDTKYKVIVTIPASSNIVPPGWYMFFVTDKSMPSIAGWCQVGGDPARFDKYGIL